MKAYLIAIALLLVIFGSIGGYLCNRFSSFANMDFTPPPVTIAASVARQDAWDEALNGVGTIRSARGIELTSESSGEVTQILFESGDRVEAGALLVVLNDRVERASYQNQQAALDLAEILFERDRALLERESIP